MTIGDSTCAAYADNHNGSITLIGKDREGSTYIEAVSTSGSKARFSVTNKWGNVFALNKTAITAAPVDTGAGVFTVAYNISPACAELHISTGSGNLSVTAENESGVDLVNGEYIVRASNHSSVDEATGIASGSFSFVPTGEINRAVTVIAHNPQKTKLEDETFEGADFASKSIAVKIGYDSYAFSPTSVSADGNYSRYDAAIGAFVLGDGESLSFALPVDQSLATPGDITVSFVPNTASADQSEKAKDAMNITASDTVRRFQREYVYNYPQGTSGSSGFAIQNSGGLYTLYHTRDYGADGGECYFGVGAEAAAVEKTNTAVRAIPFVGTVKISYTTGIGKTKSYEIPLYVEVRNCAKNYPAQ
jgi:hypothetical protein